MPDRRALVRVLDELLWALRRDGFVVSPSQAIDVARAVAAVGLDEPLAVREAVAAVVVDRASDRPRFDASFDAFFRPDAAARRAMGLWERLQALGFGEEELAALRSLLDDAPTGERPSLLALLDGGADFDRALVQGGVLGELDAHSGPLLGFRTHKLLGRARLGEARQALPAIRARLVASLGARGDALAEALAEELDRAESDVRDLVRRIYETRVAELDRARAASRPFTTPFSGLRDDEIEEVRRAVRGFAERLRGGARVRARRWAVRGRVDPHKTLRRALRTSGVPLELARRRRPRDRPKLVLVCDVSDSVRAVASFFLEFIGAVQELFSRSRSFLFVSDLAETTALFAREPARVAMARAATGGIVRAGENSNYGRAFRTFEAKHASELDRRTTLVVLGDGRTNYLDPGADALGRLRERCRSLLWLCPEPRGQWGQGDSAMSIYARSCTAVYEVACAADLERAARIVVARG